jgi:hypothetical protein
MLQTNGYVPVDVLIWFVIWSVWSGYHDVKSRTIGHYSLLRFAGVIAGLVGFHLLLRVLIYVALAKSDQISGSGLFELVVISFGPNVLFARPFATIDGVELGIAPFYDRLVRWACERVIMRSSRDKAPLVTVLVFHNSRASLQRAWDRVVDESWSATLRSKLREELTREVEEARSPFEVRGIYARMLIQWLPWKQLADLRLVPETVRDPRDVVDIETKIEEIIGLLSRYNIGPEDLDLYIRDRLRNQTTDLQVRYESLLAESDDSSERFALRVRTTFLVLELGQEPTLALIAAIEHSKRSPVATEAGPRPKGVTPPSLYL